MGDDMWGFFVAVIVKGDKLGNKLQLEPYIYGSLFLDEHMLADIAGTGGHRRHSRTFRASQVVITDRIVFKSYI